MRILFVTPYFVPAWGFGGPVKVVYDLAKSLHSRGHRVTVATTDVLDRTTRVGKDRDIVDGIEILYFRNISNTAAFRWNLYLPQGFGRWIKEHVQEFDIIHCHDLFTGLNVTVSAVAKRAGVPYILHPHGALIPARQDARFTFVKGLWLRAFHSVLDGAARVVSSTERERQEIISNQGVSGDRVVVIPNGLDTASVHRLLRSEDARARTGIRPGEYAVVYFGRIQFIKGIDISLRALALIRDLPWRFLIVGRDDGEVARLEALSKELGILDRVHFLGPKFGAELDEVLGFSELFLFNSRSESFSIAVLNACAAGLPVVLGPECRVPEVEEWNAGVVVSENTPIATAEVLRPLLPDALRLASMGTAGQRLIKEVFSLDRIVDRFLLLYQSLARRT